jgi:hypothetical protein
VGSLPYELRSGIDPLVVDYVLGLTARGFGAPCIDRGLLGVEGIR